ncbi:MAG: hypothetical protein WC123_04190 [Bacilli bacterium]
MSENNLDNLVSIEVAKKIVEDIPKEKIKAIADNALRFLMSTPNVSWDRESQLEKRVKIVFLSEIEKEISILLSKDEYSEKMKKLAKDTIDAINIRTKELMIENTSQRLSGMIVDPVNGVRPTIQQVIFEMLQK